MRYLLAVLVAVLPISAWAQCSAEISWTAPSQFTNGSPLDPATDLSEYRIYSGDGELLATPAPGTQGYTLEDLDYGTHSLTATAVGVNGIESAMSNDAVVVCVDERVPEAPSGFFAELLAFLKRVFSWFV